MGSITETATAFPGDRAAARQCSPARRDATAQRLRHRRVLASRTKLPRELSPSGPTDRWPTRSGFDKFYGFIGGETNQWAPTVWDGMTKIQIEEKPGYHFMTDMTDQAIAWVEFGEVADTRQAVLHLLRAWRNACAAPRSEGMDRQIQGPVLSGLG